MLWLIIGQKLKKLAGQYCIHFKEAQRKTSLLLNGDFENNWQRSGFQEAAWIPKDRLESLTT